MAFDWHNLSEDDFRKWMVVNLIASDRLSGNDDFDRLSQATSTFHNVELTILLNGIEVPTDYFIDQIRMNMDHLTKKAAETVVATFLDRVRDKVTDVEESLERAHEAIMSQVEKMIEGGTEAP